MNIFARNFIHFFSTNSSQCYFMFYLLNVRRSDGLANFNDEFHNRNNDDVTKLKRFECCRHLMKCFITIKSTKRVFKSNQVYYSIITI